MSDTAEAPPGARAAGMLDAVAWPQKLKAAAIDPVERRLHGYAVETDLAANYEPADTLYLALTGELPTADASRGFAVAMTFLGCVGIHEGPTHAAFLARLCNAPARAVLQVAAVALAERARAAVEELHDFLTYLDGLDGLDGGTAAPPDRYVTDDPSQAESIAHLRAALPETLSVPALRHPLSRAAGIAAVLHACGLRREDAIEAVWTIAALGPTLAEAMTAKPLAFREYPMDTPRFDYRGGR
jgi:hypothetical protein